MKNKRNTESPDNIIDIVILIKTLWREKILILFICSLGVLIPFIKNSNSIESFQTTATIQSFNNDFFSIYEYELDKNQLGLDFINSFMGVMTLNNNLTNFIDLNQNISNGYNFSDFKFDILQIENFLIKNKDNLENDSEFQKNNTYFKLTLIFKKGVNGQNFLNNYLKYSFEEAKEKFKENLKLSLNNKIEVYERNLKIALTIDMNDPVINPPGYIETQDIFFKGSKVLDQRISNLKLMINNLDNDFDKINPIFSKASGSSSVPNQENNKYLFYGFILSLFISLAVVFVKNVLK